MYNLLLSGIGILMENSRRLIKIIESNRKRNAYNTGIKYNFYAFIFFVVIYYLMSFGLDKPFQNGDLFVINFLIFFIIVLYVAIFFFIFIFPYESMSLLENGIIIPEILLFHLIRKKRKLIKFEEIESFKYIETLYNIVNFKIILKDGKKIKFMIDNYNDLEKIIAVHETYSINNKKLI
jgi:hypothetical protein